MTELVKELIEQIEWTQKNCPNAPYVPVRIDTALKLKELLEDLA